MVSELDFRSEKFHCKFGAGATCLQKRGGGGGSKAAWKFSENSSVLVRGGFPYVMTDNV